MITIVRDGSVVTKGEQFFLVDIPPQYVNDLDLRGYYWIFTHGNYRYIERVMFEIASEVNQQEIILRPGDTVRILKDYPPLFKGELFTIVKCPSKYRSENDVEQLCWITSGGEDFCLCTGMYEIVDKTKRTATTPELFLRKQMDDNLRSIFG